MVVALDGRVDDPTMMMVQRHRLGQAEQTSQLGIRSDSLRHASAWSCSCRRALRRVPVAWSQASCCERRRNVAFTFKTSRCGPSVASTSTSPASTSSRGGLQSSNVLNPRTSRSRARSASMRLVPSLPAPRTQPTQVEQKERRHQVECQQRLQEMSTSPDSVSSLSATP